MNKLPGLGAGFKTAIIGPITGFLVSAIVGAILPVVVPGTGKNLASLFNFLSVFIGIAALEKAKRWGVLYSLGYFGGLFFIGRFFMESWEYQIYLLVILSYIALKIRRKL